VPDSVRQRYVDAVAVLKRLASGEVQLAGITAVPALGGAGNAVAARTAHKLFGPAQLQGY
jgi:phage gp36-like protein